MGLYQIVNKKKKGRVVLDEPRKPMKVGHSDPIWLLSDNWKTSNPKKMIKISLDTKTHISKIFEFLLNKQIFL
jgi:hypothetical protein